MLRSLGIGLLLVPLLALACFAEDAKERPPLKFDEGNTPLDDVITKATAAKKPIFIDFFLDG